LSIKSLPELKSIVAEQPKKATNDKFSEEVELNQVAFRMIKKMFR
jgi:hypothetical protein